MRPGYREYPPATTTFPHGQPPGIYCRASQRTRRIQRSFGSRHTIQYSTTVNTQLTMHNPASMQAPPIGQPTPHRSASFMIPHIHQRSASHDSIHPQEPSRFFHSSPNNSFEPSRFYSRLTNSFEPSRFHSSPGPSNSDQPNKNQQCDYCCYQQYWHQQFWVSPNVHNSNCRFESSSYSNIQQTQCKCRPRQL